MKILITGAAGFIGFHLAKALLSRRKNKVIGIDNYDNYYSVKLKKLRTAYLKKYKNYKFLKVDLSDFTKLKNSLKTEKIDIVYHFAAQAGVRFTLENPDKYFNSNFIGTLNIFEIIKFKKIPKCFFASSSSVYGDQKKYPLKENFELNEKNIYALTKKMNEECAKNYSELINSKFICLRFFTVFGEWGRPDMLIFKYLKKYYDNKVFILNEGGNHLRDFTYIKDVINLLVKLKSYKFKNKYQTYNICSNKPKKIKEVIKIINKKVVNKKYKIMTIKKLKKIEAQKTHGSNKKILSLFPKFKFSNFEKSINDTIDGYIRNEIYKL